jgi:poly(hydroxyalkanoate) depolymerase family esterase
MSKRTRVNPWAKTFERSLRRITRQTTKVSAQVGAQVMKQALKSGMQPALARHRPPPGDGAWIAGVAMGAAGVRRFRLYRPPLVKLGERLPLMVMLHGCGQDAAAFAASTRMNRIAQRERFLVLYPEQDRLANGQRCWNWFETASGQAYGEAALIMKAVDQACLFHQADRMRVAVAGLSAGASMAALLGTRYPDRFRAVAMHSGIPPGMAQGKLTALGAMHGHRSAAAPRVASPLTPASAWPPLLVIHGDKDTVVSPRNGEAAVRAWADAASAQPGLPRATQRGQRYPALVTDFRCKKTLVATLVQVSQLAHAWSGGAVSQAFSDELGPDASRMVWRFAARQFDALQAERDAA